MDTINKNTIYFNCEICHERKIRLNNPRDKKAFICDRCERETKELEKSKKYTFCRFSKENNV